MMLAGRGWRSASLGLRLRQSPQLVHVIHSDRGVSAIAFSREGKILASAEGTTARMWDASSGRMLGKMIEHGDILAGVAFSPDGRALLTSSRDRTARIWDTATGEPVGPRLVHAAAAMAQAFSPDGKSIFIGTEDGTAHVWDPRSGKALGEPVKHHSAVMAVAYSPDGSRIATASFGGEAQVWDFSTKKPVGAALRHDGPVFVIAFGPDGKTVLTAGAADNTAKIWNAATGQPMGQPLAHADKARPNPPGARPQQMPAFNSAMTNMMDSMVAMARSSPAARTAGVPLLYSMTGGVLTAAFSPDGHTVATVGDNDAVRLWDVATAKSIGAPLQHKSTVFNVAFSARGSWIVTVSLDNTARLWDASTGNPSSSPLQHLAPVTSAAFSPDGRFLATGTAVFKPDSLPTGPAELRIWALPASADDVSTIALDGSARYAAFRQDGKAVVSVDGQTVDAMPGSLHTLTIELERQGFIRGQRNVRAWDTSSGKPLGPTIKSDAITAAFRDGGSSLVVVGQRDAQAWDVATGKPKGNSLKFPKPVNWAAVSPDGERLLTAAFVQPDPARLWDLATGKPIGEPMVHRRGVFSVAFSPDGNVALTADNNLAWIWDASTGLALVPPLDHGGFVARSPPALRAW